MNVPHLRRTSAFVEVVDVLRDERHFPRILPLKPRNGAMRVVGLFGEKETPPVVVKALDDIRLKASTDTVMALYKSLGGNDQVAKGPRLRDAAKNDLGSRFQK